MYTWLSQTLEGFCSVTCSAAQYILSKSNIMVLRVYHKRMKKEKKIVHRDFVLGDIRRGNNWLLLFPFPYWNRKSWQRKVESCQITNKLSPFQEHFGDLIIVSSMAELPRKMVIKLPTSSFISGKRVDFSFMTLLKAW